MTPLNYLLPVGLLLIGFFTLLLSSLLRQREYDEQLRRSEARFHSFFENSPISLWEEDFSGVKSLIDSLKESGTKDFRAYFESHPEVVAECAKKVRVLDVNRATLQLYVANDKRDFLRDLSIVFGGDIHEAFREELIAIAAGKTSFESEDINETFTG